MSSASRIGLVSPLPPQVGGVASVAGWLLDHEDLMDCVYAPFDLERPLHEKTRWPLRLHAVPRQLRQLGRFIRWMRRSPVAVHYCVSCSRTGLPRDALYLALLRLGRRRAIAHIHGAHLALAADKRFRRLLLRVVGWASAERVALSPTSVEILARIGIPSRFILNPLRFEPGDARPVRNSAPLRLLFVGAYGRRKGCPELVAALALVRERDLDVTLSIVGKEDRKGDAELVTNEIRSHRLNGAVEFLGVQAAEDMPDIYRGADVVCLPSRHEGLPMALLEAMGFGLPAIATPVGGVADLVVDGKTGFLVAPGNIEELAEAIVTLAGDPDLRRRLGTAGRERVFALAGAPVIAAKWRDLYSELARTEHE